MSERYLERKFTVRAHGRALVLHKREQEKPEHRVMMALLWAMYLPSYPDIRIDVPVGVRYRPDLVQLDAAGQPVFWGECGAVGAEKLEHLCHHYRDTHLVLAKWETRLDRVAQQIERALRGVRRTQPIELIGLHSQHAHAIAASGEIDSALEGVERLRWETR